MVSIATLLPSLIGDPCGWVKKPKVQRNSINIAISWSGYLLMVASLIALFLTKSLFSPSPVVIILQVAAALLMIWARLSFGLRSFHAGANTTRGGLVTSGPYRYVRHPIYAAVFYFVLAGALPHLSVTTVGLFVVLVIGISARIVTEERFLKLRYPQYVDYCSKTKRLIPHLV